MLWDYLFYRYETGAYDSEFNGSNERMGGGFTQVLWGLEGGSGPAFTSVNTLWASDLNAYNTTSTLRSIPGEPRLSILLKMSMMFKMSFTTRFPSPSASRPIGFGLAGVAMVRRKIKK